MTTKKADYIWFNGEMVPWGEAKVHVMSHALHYGTSVFEGIRCYDSHKGPVVFRHREHMQRLHDSAKIYRFPVSQSVDELMEACREVIRTNNLTSAYIRPLVLVVDVVFNAHRVRATFDHEGFGVNRTVCRRVSHRNAQFRLAFRHREGIRAGLEQRTFAVSRIIWTVFTCQTALCLIDEIRSGFQ